MSGTYREHLDSREAYTDEDRAAYHEDMQRAQQEEWPPTDVEGESMYAAYVNRKLAEQSPQRGREPSPTQEELEAKLGLEPFPPTVEQFISRENSIRGIR